jgi:hypothetical protein
MEIASVESASCIRRQRITEIDESLEAGIGEAIHALKPSGAAFHHLANADDEMSGKNLGTLLARVTELE